MISLSDIREVTGLPPDKDAQNAILRDVVISQWEEYTKTKWVRDASAVLVREPPTTNERITLWGPNVSVTEVKEWHYSEADDGEVLTLTDADNDEHYTVIARQNRTMIVPVNHRWARFVQVTHSIGYEELPSTLNDVRMALVEQVKFLQRRFEGDKGVMESQALEGATTSFIKGAVSPLFKSVADKYKKKF